MNTIKKCIEFFKNINKPIMKTTVGPPWPIGMSAWQCGKVDNC